MGRAQLWSNLQGLFYFYWFEDVIAPNFDVLGYHVTNSSQTALALNQVGGDGQPPSLPFPSFFPCQPTQPLLPAIPSSQLSGQPFQTSLPAIPSSHPFQPAVRSAFQPAFQPAFLSIFPSISFQS